MIKSNSNENKFQLCMSESTMYLDRASNCVAMVMGNMNKYYRGCYAVSKSIQICKLLIDYNIFK